MHLRAAKLSVLLAALLGFEACDRPSGGDGKTGEATGGERAWEIVNPHSSAWPLGPVAVGGKGFVSKAGNGVRFSADGKSWRDAKLPASRNGSDVGKIIFGADRYVMLRRKEILASDDGASWEIRVDGAKYFYSAAYGNGVFVAGGPHGSLMISKDGKAWNESRMDTSMDFTSMEFGNGAFVAVNSEKDEIWYSPDAMNWSKVQDIEIPPREEDEERADESGEDGYAEKGPSYVIFGNGRFLVVGRQFYQSKDGRTWQADGASLEEPVYFANDRFIAFERNGDNGPVGVATSKDLAEWDRQETDLDFKPDWVAYLNGRYVTAKDPGDHGFYAVCSPELSHWSPADMATVQNLHGIAFGGNRFVAVGDSGTVLTSPDGFAWSAEKKPTSENLAEVAYGNGTFVAVGFRGPPLRSRNGEAWEAASSAPAEGLSSVVFGNGLFVAVAGGNTTAVLVSENGKAWTRVAVGEMIRPKLVFGNGVFLLAGEDKVFRSTDARQWSRSWLGGKAMSEIGFDGSRFFFRSGGVSATGWSKLESVDGVDWNENPSLPEARRESVPEDKGEAILAKPRIYWRTSDTLFELAKPGVAIYASEYGNGVFVGVGFNGAVAALQIPYRPAAGEGPARAVAGEKTGPFAARLFLGQLDGRYLIRMRLTHAGESLAGDYRYLRQTASLRLQGRMAADGEFTLRESLPGGKSTGTMAGRLYRGTIRGEWADPQGTKRLSLMGREATDKQMSEMAQRFAAAYAKRVGTYLVSDFGDMVGANTMYGCDRKDTGWSCGGSSLSGGLRTPFEGFDPDFDPKLISSIRVEIKKDLTVEVFVKGKSRWIQPAGENRLAFFRERNAIAKGIRIKEMAVADSRENGIFDLFENENGLMLDGHPQMELKKIP
jgi:hypothetical protein